MSNRFRAIARSPQRAGVLAAGVVVLFGFVALTALSLTGRWDVGRSMWDYRSATWGDALVLPILVGVLAAALADPRLPRDPADRRWAALGALAFGLAGLAVQVSWLAASDPIPNWTLPRAHRFSLPGWYHAAFLVTTSAAVGGGVGMVLRRLRNAAPAARDALARTLPAAAFCAAAVAFAVLLALDSADSSRTSAGQGSIAAATGTVLTLAAAAAWAVGWRSAMRLLVLGTIGAAAIVAASLLTHGG